MKLFVPFEVLSKSDGDDCIVEGYASTEALDSQGEIVKREALERALPDYMKFGNIREMHQPSAVGVAISAEHDEKGLRLRANIVDPVARKKVEAGVYKAFSIGGRVTNRDKVDKAVITGLHLTEISLVDRPANPEAMFDVWKADGVEPGAEDMTKGMYAVQLLASLVDQVNCLTNHSKAEEAMEGDSDSVVPAELQSVMAQLTQTLKDMVEEEAAEIMEDHQPAAPMEVIVLAEPEGDVAKVDEPVVETEAPAETINEEDVEKRGARHSAADQGKLNAAHDAVVAAGAHCDAMKHESPSDLAKANADLVTDLAKAQTALATAEASLASITTERDQVTGTLAELTKAHSLITDQRDDLAKKHDELVAAKAAVDAELVAVRAEFEKLKAQPEPMKGKVVAVAKGDDVTAAAPRTSSTASAPKDRPSPWFTTRPTGELITAIK